MTAIGIREAQVEVCVLEPHDQEATVSMRLDATKGPSQGMD